MDTGLLGLPWMVWAVLALAVAGAYIVFQPRAEIKVTRSPWSRFVLRWFHALVWALLAGSFLLRMAGPGTLLLANALALAALACYFIFMVTLLRARRQRR